MFEDSLVESRIGHISSSKRWTAIASITLQVAVAALVIALPLLHPEALASRADSPKLLLPLLPKPPAPVVRVEHQSAPSTTLPTQSVAQPRIMPSLLPSSHSPSNDAPPLASIAPGMGAPGSFSGIAIAEGLRGPNVTVAPAAALAGHLHISLGVAQGLLIAPIRPIYPAIAKAAHVEGVVVIEAVISRTGTIESLHVISGPPMLQNAAIEAIRAARYKPFRLNGEPTDVQTTITVNFRMHG